MLSTAVVPTTSTLQPDPVMEEFISGKLLHQNFTAFSKIIGIILVSSSAFLLLRTGWPQTWKTWNTQGFSEHGKLSEFSGNSVQPQGKL